MCQVIRKKNQLEKLLLFSLLGSRSIVLHLVHKNNMTATNFTKLKEKNNQQIYNIQEIQKEIQNIEIRCVHVIDR